MMDTHNTYKKPLPAFLILVLLSAVVALGRYFSAAPTKPDIIIDFAPLLAAVFLTVIYKLVENIISASWFAAAAFVSIVSLWTYQQFLQISQTDYILVFGFSTLLIWYGTLSRIQLGLAVLALIAAVLVFKFMGQADNHLLLYYAVPGFVSLLLAFYINTLLASARRERTYTETNTRIAPEPLFQSPSKEKEEPDNEPVISILAGVDPDEEQDWGLVIQKLYGVLKSVPDVDQMFNKTLQYLHKVIDYDAAAVGLIQDKAINKIAELGPESLLHSSVIDWNSGRINEVKQANGAVLGQQKHLGAENKNVALYRMDIPVMSTNNMLGIISIFRTASLFNEYETRLAFNIAFHSMLALRQSRLQEEVKRLSGAGKNKTLFSREQFIEKSNLELDELSRPRAFSILIIEIDNFEDIKTRYGVEASLAAYKKVAAALMSSLSERDILGRYGKEGFIVLLHETDLLDAKKVAETIRKKVEQIKFKIPDGVSSTTVSIGLTTVSDQNENMMSIIRKADMGLFVAKESGYNTVKVSL